MSAAVLASQQRHPGGQGTWIGLHSGRRLDPFDPHPDDIALEDIAHALSHAPRFTGHTRAFYCPTPDQRVLMADLEWRPAGDLRVGDELLAFDEHPVERGSAAKNRRRFRHAYVTAAVPVRRPVIRLEMEDGASVVASAEHPWLVATKASRNQKWQTSAEIAASINRGGRRYMHRFVTPWDRADSYDAGWLAGILDGEGSLSVTGRAGVCLSVAQKPGLVLDRVERLLAEFGIPVGCYRGGSSGVTQAQLRGGWRELLRVLGHFRPVRLLQTYRAALLRGDFAKQLDGIAQPLRIVKAYDEGERWVSGLETSTHTYFCEGFGAHNSVAQHSVLCCQMAMELDVPVARMAVWGLDWQRQALLHDASEAYLCDLARPVKYHPGMAAYRAAEQRLQATIFRRFAVSEEMHPEVKRIDDRMLVTEARQLLVGQDLSDWHLERYGAPFALDLTPWSPHDAKLAFLAVARVLGLA